MSEFVFDGEAGRIGEVHVFDADADAGEAVAHFTARFDEALRARQPETEPQDSALGKLLARIDEHAARGDVGRAQNDGARGAFVEYGEITDRVKAQGRARRRKWPAVRLMIIAGGCFCGRARTSGAGGAFAGCGFTTAHAARPCMASFR